MYLYYRKRAKLYRGKMHVSCTVSGIVLSPLPHPLAPQFKYSK